MKKLIITSIGIITVAGAVSFSLLNQPDTTTPSSSVTVSKPLEATETIKEAEVPIIEEEVNTQPLETVEPQEEVTPPVDENIVRDFKEVSAYIRENVADPNSAQAVFETFIYHKEPFYADKEATVSKCLKFIEENPNLRTRMKTLFGTEYFPY